MDKPLITIQLVVFNGEKYIRECLWSVVAQAYPNLEVIIFDNASTDQTREIVTRDFPQFRLMQSQKNIGMWPGQERVLSESHGKYVVALSVDVMLHPQFIENAATVMEHDDHIGALQAKVYQYEYSQLQHDAYRKSTVIDTCGFTIAQSRRIGNRGHGMWDYGQFDQPGEVFGVEGAVPIFRRTALEHVRIEGTIIDRDYFWYGDDLDLAWRMRLFGFLQWYDPTVIAYHDRSTTKAASTKPIIGQLLRRAERHKIPVKKRRLDWSNVRFTIIKNDYIINILKDLPYILAREISVFVYTVLFEPAVLAECTRFFRLVPNMLRKRSLIMSRAVASPQEIHRWMTSM